jgi:hypothetical protein
VNEQSNKGGTSDAPAEHWELGRAGLGRADRREDHIRRKRHLNEILADRAGQPYEKIERDTDREYSPRLAIGPGGTNEESWR